MNSILLSVIIPIYNEEKTIIPLLKKVKQQKISKEIIVINDGSSDRTSELLKMNSDYYDKYISLENNNGKGYAIKMGIDIAQGTLTLIQDGDLEYNPNDYEKLINKIGGDCKIVYGSRTLKGGNFTTPGGLRPIFSKFANFLLTKLSNILNGQNLTDAHTCYKLFSTEILKKIVLKEKGFAFCPEVTAKLSKLGLKIQEVPIDYFGRSYGEGKKIKVRHAFEAIIALLIYNFPYKRFKSWLRG
tara:strand:+ start:144 stop:872 length:729 start_codon:yes stop_codon:yes gene_type:complete